MRVPETLVRVGKNDQSLDTIIGQSRERWEQINLGLGNTVKYVAFGPGENPYLLMISRQKDGILTPPGYNVILTSTSYSSSQNESIAGQVFSDLHIPTGMEVPEGLRNMMQLMNLTLPAFESDPEGSMKTLKEGRLF